MPHLTGLSLRRKWALTIILAVCLPGGCTNLVVPDSPGPDTMADFETAWQTVKRVYPYFEFKHINWDSIHSVYYPRAVAAQGDEITGVLFSMLAELRDGHVSLETRGGAWMTTYHPPRAERDRYLYSPEAVRNYFAGELRLAGDQRVEYEILPGNIGYVYVATLSKDEPVLDGFDEALAYLKATRGLILDVRHNGGGTDYNSFGIIGRLIAAPIDGLPFKSPDGTLHQGYPIAPRGPFQYTKPVVLLIDGVCFSSCEDFAEMVKHVPTVIALGDTTAGGSGAPFPFSLPSGRRINVSTQYFPRYDGQPIEWNGVLPDIRVVNSEIEIRSGRDRQLEAAIAQLGG